jgi:hypothetical protein
MTRALGSRPFELLRFARLQVVTPSPQLGEDAGLLHLPLECLERPIEAVSVREVNLWHDSSVDKPASRISSVVAVPGSVHLKQA